MSQSEEYRAKAEECRQMAERALSPLDKEAWLKLAADWLGLLTMRQRTAFESASDRFDARERADGTHQTKSESEH